MYSSHSMKKYLFAIFPIILFCGFIVFPAFAQEGISDVEEPESKITPIEREEQIPQIEITNDGIYTKSRLKTQVLEFGQEVQIVFVLRESMIGETTKAVVRHQVVTTQDALFDTKDSTEIRFDLLNSKEIIFPFSPQETGEFFLKQQIVYSHDDGVSSVGGVSMIPFHVVDKFSKAADEDGFCKKSTMVNLFKPDFSTNVCVTPQTAIKLMTRWY